MPTVHDFRDDNPPLRKPPWIRSRLPAGEAYHRVRELMSRQGLHTVCREAACPNLGECWSSGTATFLILGDVCTRNCAFCAVKTGNPGGVPVDPSEPLAVAEAVAAMELRHAVITSVTRDDLPDGGAQVFAATIRAVRDRVPGCTVEVLVPDFSGDSEALDVVLDAHPEVLGHNLETVLRLYPRVRPRAQYRRSLDLLEAAKKKRPDLLTKSGIMLGLGEIPREIFRVMEDLRGVHCDILTLGQYLRPSIRKLPVERYYPPREFEALRKAGMDAGFRWVEAGPLVRSSYHAATPVQALRT